VDGHHPHPTLLLTPEETAREIRSGRHKVYDLIASGELASIALGYRADGTACQRRIERAEVERYIARLKAEQAGSAA
jgi:excisionase family DNA binding protein